MEETNTCLQFQEDLKNFEKNKSTFTIFISISLFVTKVGYALVSVYSTYCLVTLYLKLLPFF